MTRPNTARPNTTADGSTLVIHDAEVAGRAGRCIVVESGMITAVGVATQRRLAVADGARHLDAHGGAVIPGLWDHHLHLPASAAAAVSVDCGPPAVRSVDDLREALAEASPDAAGWIRGVGYHEDVAGDLDAVSLDRLRNDVPVRIQHRSGGLWILNGPATRIVAGADGRGRLLRDDGALRRSIGELDLNYETLGIELARSGVVGFTEATPGLDRKRALDVVDQVPQKVVLLSASLDPTRDSALHRRVRIGPAKRLLTEDNPPDLDELESWIGGHHLRGRAVALHVVSREMLALTVAVFRAVGTITGDRLEHVSVAPPELAEAVADLGLAVVTQPNFVAERGDSYRRDVDEHDQPWLYRLAGWHRLGAPLAAGTDAPYGRSDPWPAMRAAISRRSASGVVIGGNEALDLDGALALFTGDPMAPGRVERSVAPGQPGDLCVLDRPWSDMATADLTSHRVTHTVIDGETVWSRPAGAESVVPD